MSLVYCEECGEPHNDLHCEYLRFNVDGKLDPKGNYLKTVCIACTDKFHQDGSFQQQVIEYENNIRHREEAQGRAPRHPDRIEGDGKEISISTISEILNHFE